MSPRPAETTVQKGRIVASREDYDALVWEVVFGQECACGCGRAAESAHHLVPRGQGGDDVIENLIPLAGDGVRLCHGALETAQRTYDIHREVYVYPLIVKQGVARYLREHPEKIAYTAKAKSATWLTTRGFPMMVCER